MTEFGLNLEDVRGDRVALAMGFGIIRLLEAGAWDFRIAIGFVKKPGRRKETTRGSLYSRRSRTKL